MFYYDRGCGPALLLIHGMFGDHLDWAPILAPLAEVYRVIAVDLPGFGASEKRDIEYTPEVFTTQLKELLDNLGIDAAAVAGNSFGGQIAMSLALAHPERVKKLILITTGGLHQYTGQEIEANLERLSEHNLMQFTPAIHAPLFGRLFFTQGTALQQSYIEKQNAKLTRPDYRDYVRVLHRSIRLSMNLCLLDELPRLKMPALLIHGEHDPVVQAQWVRDAVPLFPDGRLVTIPACAHIPQLEHPARVMDEIGTFLS